MLGTLAALILQATAPAAVPAADCGQPGTRTYETKAALPPGVVEAFLRPLAEIGAPFPRTRTTADGVTLYAARFVSAKQTGCRLALTWDQDGFAYVRDTDEFERRGDRWVPLEPAG
jgi:hypothetical protein